MAEPITAGARVKVDIPFAPGLSLPTRDPADFVGRTPPPLVGTVLEAGEKFALVALDNLHEVVKNSPSQVDDAIFAVAQPIVRVALDSLVHFVEDKLSR